MVLQCKTGATDISNNIRNFISTLTISSLTVSVYGCENWLTNSSIIHKVNVSWNNCYWRIFSCCWQPSAKLQQYFTGNIVYLIHNRSVSAYILEADAHELLVGQQEGHPACKNWVVGCWHGYLPGQGADLHMAQLTPLSFAVSCSSKSRLVLPFWYWLTKVVLDKDVKWV